MSARLDVAHAYLPVAGGVFAESFCKLSDIGTDACAVAVIPTGSSPTATPNDPAYSGLCAGVPCQWGLQQINVSPAWSMTYGSPDIVVAVLDTGIAAGHLDLAANVMMIGTSPGLNIVEPGNPPVDENGHGTIVSGVLSAVTNNGAGMSGISQSKILAVQVCDDQGACAPQHVAMGMADAAVAGAGVISMSFGIPYDPLVERALNLSAALDIVLIAAVGNRNQAFVHFPASHPHVIAVSGVNLDGQPSVSNYGSKVEIAAPSGGGGRNQYDIYTTTNDGHYGYAFGTSIAVPHVSGAAALLRAEFPAMSADDVRTRLRESASPQTATTPDERYGYGILNAGRAMNAGL